MASLPKQKVFSALEVAKICGVVNQTVINWIRAGRLQASTTPGGQFRVYPEDLRAFLLENSMKVPEDLKELLRMHETSFLVVEDDRVFNDLLSAHLRRAWPEGVFYQAFDGFEAGSLLGVHKPQVVVLDLNLPGVDGFELCRRIKKQPGFDQPLVVAITSSNEPGLEERMSGLGSDAFFRKPLDFEAMVSMLAKRLSR
jgi:excisionase family DNA binding protein